MLPLAELCSQCVRKGSKKNKNLTGRYRSHCWWMKAHSCYMSINITYYRMFFSLCAALYKLSCMLFGRILLPCKSLTNCGMKQLVLPAASKSWCLTACSDSCFSFQFGCLPIREHSVVYSWLIRLLRAWMFFWLKGSYTHRVRWAAMDK